jgi:hypothetical protein
MVVMMWAYFDESGYDNRNTQHRERLERLTIGGCMASCEAWDGFEAEWRSVLGDIECFRMADFERWAPPFDFKLADGSRDHARHRGILNGLLDVIGRRVPYALGFTRIVSKPSNALKDTYARCLIDTIMHLASASADRLNDKVSIIFARHKEISLQRIDECVENHGDARFGTVGTDTPINLCQLQAADIISYELSRMHRAECPQYYRHPLRKLSELGCAFHFSISDP